MLIYNTDIGLMVYDENLIYSIEDLQLDDFFLQKNAIKKLKEDIVNGKYPIFTRVHNFLAPIGAQEVWAAGVTYYRSRTARMNESGQNGGSGFYEKVYNSKRPELFFKATPHRVVGHNQPMKIRSDSKWNVPEPELALAINRYGEIIGYTVGND